MLDSLNPKPLPTYRIPFTITRDGQECAGLFCPVDDYEPCRSYMVMIDGKWQGMLHHWKPSWQTDTEWLKPYVEELGETVMLWHQ